MNTNEIKPGYKTSECWIAIIALLVGVPIAAGVFTSEEGAAVESAAGELVRAIFGFLLVAGPAMVYINGRSKIKAAAPIAGAAIEPA